MRILVTGAAGFIGSQLANRYAAEGNVVIGIDNYEDAGNFKLDPRVRMVWGDIRRRQIVDAIADLKPDLINHHAAKIDPRWSMLYPADDAQTNYIGTINVVDGARKAGCSKIIFASSCAVYGSGPMSVGQAENPNCPYGISKLASEKYIRMIAKTSNLRFVILRYPNVYGPSQSGTRSTGVIAIFARAMARNLPITIYGDGLASYQYRFINDIVDANMAATCRLSVTSSGSLLTNVPGDQCSVHSLAEMIAENFPGYVIRIVYEKARDGEQQCITMTGGTVEYELGWLPVVSLREGISRVTKAAKEDAKKDAENDNRAS